MVASVLETQAKEIALNFRRLHITIDSWNEWTLDNAYNEVLHFQVQYLYSALKEQVRQYNLTVDGVIEEE